MREWLKLALSPAVVSRSLRVGLVVGTLLIVINHGDALLAAELDPGRLTRMALTYLVPYGVATYAAVAALRSR